MEFKTADEDNAGTDANVYFQLFGEEGETQEVDVGGKGSFLRGHSDRFRVRTADVGRVSVALFLKLSTQLVTVQECLFCLSTFFQNKVSIKDIVIRIVNFKKDYDITLFYCGLLIDRLID